MSNLEQQHAEEPETSFFASQTAPNGENRIQFFLNMRPLSLKQSLLTNLTAMAMAITMNNDSISMTAVSLPHEQYRKKDFFKILNDLCRLHSLLVLLPLHHRRCYHVIQAEFTYMCLHLQTLTCITAIMFRVPVFLAMSQPTSQGIQLKRAIKVNMFHPL